MSTAISYQFPPVPGFPSESTEWPTPRVPDWLARAFDPPRRGTDFWEHAAREDELTEIARLPDNWDGCGATAVTDDAIAHAQALLAALDATGDAPDLISPSPAGTVLFEWESSLGTAHLEIGRSTFGFYTSPTMGNAMLYGGGIGGLNAKKIRVAVTTILPRSTTSALGLSGRAVGF